MIIPKQFSTVRLSNVGNSGLPLAFLKLYTFIILYLENSLYQEELNSNKSTFFFFIFAFYFCSG